MLTAYTHSREVEDGSCHTTLGLSIVSIIWSLSLNFWVRTSADEWEVCSAGSHI